MMKVSLLNSMQVMKAKRPLVITFPMCRFSSAEPGIPKETRVVYLDKSQYGFTSLVINALGLSASVDSNSE